MAAAISEAANRSASATLAKAHQRTSATYYFFDSCYCNASDIRKAPLLQRKEFLRQLLSGDDRVRFFEHHSRKAKNSTPLRRRRARRDRRKQIESRTPEIAWFLAQIQNRHDSTP